MKKRILSALLGALFMWNCIPFTGNFAYAEQLNDNSKYIFHGHAEINQNRKTRNDDIFTGEQSTVEEGSKVRMTVANVLSAGYTEAGDEFFAEIVEDVEGKNGIVIPVGSVAHGSVTSLAKSKRLGRDGYIVLNFDYILTPDGREIPIEAHMTTKPNLATSIGKTVAKDTGYMLGGGVVGGIASLQILGLPAAIASHGYTVAGGAGLGAAVGLGYAVGRKGKEVLISPGDEINVKITNALKLPVIKESAFKEKEQQYDGLDVKITGYKVEKDPFDEPNLITLSLVINNATPKTFSSFDMALVNDYKNEYYPSPFSNTDVWFTKVKPNDRMAGKISFSVDNPKRKFWLVFYDSMTRKPLAKISVENAKRNIAKQEKLTKKK